MSARALGTVLLSLCLGCVHTADAVRAPMPVSAPVGATAERTQFEQDVGAPPLTEKQARANRGLFWTGVVMGAVGGADGLTRTEHDDLVSRGETMDALTVTSAAVGLVGLALATITAGIEYSRCGSRGRERYEHCASR